MNATAESVNVSAIADAAKANENMAMVKVGVTETASTNTAAGTAKNTATAVADARPTENGRAVGSKTRARIVSFDFFPKNCTEILFNLIERNQRMTSRTEQMQVPEIACDELL